MMNPNQNTHNLNPQNVQLPKQPSKSWIIAVLMTVGFVTALGFGLWAFMGKQENQTNLDKKIADASAVAVAKAEEAKEKVFTEREKDPFKTYTGSATFGSLSFSYPKSWSIYQDEKTSDTILNFFGQPNFISGLESSSVFAFRAQILSSSYDSEASKLQKLVESGKLTVVAFQPKNVPTTVGLLATGELAKDKVGRLLILPQRDKTFKFWTESNDYLNDFNRIIETINFVP